MCRCTILKELEERQKTELRREAVRYRRWLHIDLSFFERDFATARMVEAEVIIFILSHIAPA